MAGLKLKKVSNRLVTHTDLSVKDGSLFVVVGPSGAGKTSLLRIICGLDAHRGEVLLDGRDISSLPPHKRGIGYLSQNLHLFPHLTVLGNLLLAMNRLGKKRAGKKAGALELLNLMRIKHLAGRRAGTLSGGESQRAALARSLAGSPGLLLLDEPFSKLDFRTAAYLRKEFTRIQKLLGLTTILVTHSMEEAEELADNLAVMQGGVLSEAGTIDGFNGIDAPADDDAFLEPLNIIPLHDIKAIGNGLVEGSWPGGRLLIADEGRPFERVAIRAREIDLGSRPPDGPDINRFTGRITRVRANGGALKAACMVKGLMLEIESEPKAEWALGLKPGDEVHGMMRLKSLRPV